MLKISAYDILPWNDWTREKFENIEEDMSPFRTQRDSLITEKIKFMVAKGYIIVLKTTDDFTALPDSYTSASHSGISFFMIKHSILQ